MEQHLCIVNCRDTISKEIYIVTKSEDTVAQRLYASKQAPPDSVHKMLSTFVRLQHAKQERPIHHGITNSRSRTRMRSR